MRWNDPELEASERARKYRLARLYGFKLMIRVPLIVLICLMALAALPMSRFFGWRVSDFRVELVFCAAVVLLTFPLDAMFSRIEKRWERLHPEPQ